MGVVFLGGTFGALARYALESTLPAPDGWPLPTLVINICGAFVLGVLLEALLRHGPDAGRLRLIRLGAGTGFLGAFTTYSTFAVEAVQLQLAADYLGAVSYVLLSVVGGVMASAAGILIAARCHPRKAANDKPASESR